MLANAKILKLKVIILNTSKLISIKTNTSKHRCFRQSQFRQRKDRSVRTIDLPASYQVVEPQLDRALKPIAHPLHTDLVVAEPQHPTNQLLCPAKTWVLKPDEEGNFNKADIW
jgi:hypothetical protein